MDTPRAICLNVNPAESTLGSINTVAGGNLLRRSMDIKGASIARRKSGRLLRAFFGSTSIPASRSLALLALRMVASAGFITLAVISFHSSAGLAVSAIIFAVSSIFGLANRAFMAIAAFTLMLASGLTFEAGQLPWLYPVMAIVSLIIGATGPGRYSADAVLRRRIFRAIRRRETRRLMERRFSYRAYHYSHLL